MPNIFIDTNLLVYINTPGKSYDRYFSFYEDQIRENRAFINMIVIDELLYVSRSKYKVPYNETLEFIETLVFPFTTLLPIEEADYFLMKEMLGYCPQPSDSLIAASMKRASIETILSEDSGFDRVPSIKRKWLTV
ncbi:MAG: type II toxin-antitoxin system VapC family toxin [Thermoplasmataceae archaeon]